MRALLYSFCGALSQAALVLLTGLSAWLLPLWAVGVLARSIAVGLCAALCLDAVRMGVSQAVEVSVCIGTSFFVAFFSELRLGILPLSRRTEPRAEDREYLCIGMRRALWFVLLSVMMTAAVLLFLSRMPAA